MRITDKSLIVLGVIALILIVSTMFNYSPKKAETGFQKGSDLIKDIDINKIAKIKIISDVGSLNVKKDKDGYVIEERSNYPADVKQMNDLIINTIDIKCNKLVTSLESNYAALGVDEKSSDTVKLIFLDDQDKELVNLLVGKREEKGTGAYVRKAGEKEVYATEKFYFVSPEAYTYLDKKVFKFTMKDIAKIDVNNGTDKYSIINDNTEIKLQNVPKSKQAKVPEVQAAFNALTQLNFEDVAAKESKKDLKWTTSYVCSLSNGLTYTADLAKEGDDAYYIKVSAEAKEVKKEEPKKEETKEEAKKDEGKKEESKEKAAPSPDTFKSFNEKHSQWVYKVGKYTADNMSKSFSGMIEDIPAKTPEKKAEVTTEVKK